MNTSSFLQMRINSTQNHFDLSFVAETERERNKGQPVGSRLMISSESIRAVNLDWRSYYQWRHLAVMYGHGYLNHEMHLHKYLSDRSQYLLSLVSPSEGLAVSLQMSGFECLSQRERDVQQSEMTRWSFKSVKDYLKTRTTTFHERFLLLALPK